MSMNNILGLPGAYTETLADQTISNLIGGLRIPLFIGVASETLEITDYEMIRGSSATADNYMANEDVSNQLNGDNRSFIVSHFPIVTGSGQGIIAYDPQFITVTVDGTPAGVSNLYGNTGEVVLSMIPESGAVVTISYYFKRTDTLITNDDLSIQANSVNLDFKVNFPPIVDGSNGGVATTDITKVTITVATIVNNKTITTTALISAVDGQSGVITLALPPVAGSKVLATYYTNTWQDTSDYLPVSNIVDVIRVGTAPGRSDFTNTVDFVIQGNQIQWGASFSVTTGVVYPNTTPFNSQINAYLYDNRAYLNPAFGIVDGVNTSFTLEYVPTQGTGFGIPTDDVNHVIAYVGTSVANARTNGPVAVETLSGSEHMITLQNAPAIGQLVYVTYWYNLISDDTYTLTCVVPSTPLTAGTYQIVSVNNGNVLSIIENKSAHAVANPLFATEGITYPAGGFDGQTIPGYSVVEDVLLNFFNNTDFWVLSSLGPSGSNGSGSLGQTYIDGKTGLRFTIMPGSISTLYTSGDLLEFDVQLYHNTAVIPFYDIPGLKTTITNINGVIAANTAILNTFNKSGNDPAVGSFYYVTVDYEKTNFPIKVYTKIKDVVNDMGPISTDNKLSLAASLAFTNGAVAMVLAQVVRNSTGIDADIQAYTDVLSTIESPIKGYGVKPNIICPLSTNVYVIDAVRIHCEKLSTIRYSSERTGVFGFAIGTLPEQAQAFAKNMVSQRMIGIYPDGAVVGLLDQVGNVQLAAVDGSFLAAAFAGLAVSPVYDVATPLTNKRIIGFNSLIRQTDIVTLNQTAVSGLTVLQDLVPDFLIRQATTTNVSTVLTREPTVVFIQDYVQQQMRIVLDPYIGVKFLSTVLQDIEVSVDGLMNNLVNLQIITAYNGTTAVQDSSDPTLCNVETFYSPVFPLLWCRMAFNLRVSL